MDGDVKDKDEPGYQVGDWETYKVYPELPKLELVVTEVSDTNTFQVMNGG